MIPKISTVVILSFLLLSCDPPSNNNNPNGSPDSANSTCDQIPSSALNGGSFCSSISDKWTKVTYDSSNDQYTMICNLMDNQIYPDQSAFNSAEDVLTILTSNNDYKLNSNCASGSLFYDDGTIQKIILIYWEKI